ncbi:MAG TPA: DMT family transporter [Roseiarcus sp.]|nr:DMT family transporter [Roseiarcus sp.]
MTQTYSPPLAASPGVDRAAWAALLVGTAIVAWSGVLVRFLDVGPLAGAAWRMGLAAPALAVWSRWAARGRAPPTRGDLAAVAWPLALSGLAFAVDVGSFHLSLTGTKVANASFIGSVAPILAVVGGALFFRERAAPRVWPALALALMGAWMMAGMASPGAVKWGDAFALNAALAYAAYLMFIKRIRERLDGPTATLISAIVSAFLLAGAAVARGETLVPSSPLGWAIVFLLGFVSHAMGQGLTSVALGRVPVAQVALVLLAQPPVSALIAWVVLDESMTQMQMAGGLIILAAVFLARPR